MSAKLKWRVNVEKYLMRMSKHQDSKYKCTKYKCFIPKELNGKMFFFAIRPGR